MNTPADQQAILSEAAHWLMLIHCAPLDQQQQTELAQWQQRSAHHQHVWQRAQGLQQTLSALPQATNQQRLLSRRQLISCLAYLGVLAPITYSGYRYLPWQQINADYHTRVGQQRQVVLADGSILWLNTNTVVNIDFNPQQRSVRLHSGEIYIETSKINHHAPLIVHTSMGTVRALGTRFSVRHDKNSASVQVSVQAQRVIITTAKSAQQQVLSANQTASYDQLSIDQITANSLLQPSWLKGELSADKLTLRTFINELSRYRPGIIQCHDEIAHLTVSGLFQLNDTDQILNLLQQTLPITIKYL
ncbi:MAG: FecR family protein, partial [Gammaproteobacteria bacterium]|nr:FecR family protein [Gammaproteobacteria bacterium]